MNLSTATSSPFSFFTSKTSTPKPLCTSSGADDELIQLDINTALFPGGPADPFSPSSFHNLLQNAEGLLRRFQAAYQLQRIAMHDIAAESGARREELEEAEVRARHLKIQLDDMAAKVADRDSAIRKLETELSSERHLRRVKGEEARRQNLILASRPSGVSLGEGAQISLSETRQAKRDSDLSLASDSGFESEDDSSAESVFSIILGPTSPGVTVSSASSTTSPDPFHRIALPPVAATATAPSNRPDLGPHRTSTFQKLLKGFSIACPEKRRDSADSNARSSCSNCHGGSAAEAWNVVSVLQGENKGLKDRIEDLEQAVEGCLDVVGALGTP